MTEKEVKQLEAEKFPLDPKARRTLALVLPKVSGRLGKDCVDFVSAIRKEAQDDVANALWYFTLAMSHIPRELRLAKTSIWSLMLLIKEQQFNKNFMY